MTVIEGNKDEAFRCIDIAVQAFAEGKLEKAEKFLIKAEKLYPTQKAKGEFKFLCISIKYIKLNYLDYLSDFNKFKFNNK